MSSANQLHPNPFLPPLGRHRLCIPLFGEDKNIYEWTKLGLKRCGKQPQNSASIDLCYNYQVIKMGEPQMPTPEEFKRLSAEKAEKELQEERMQEEMEEKRYGEGESREAWNEREAQEDED